MADPYHYSDQGNQFLLHHEKAFGPDTSEEKNLDPGLLIVNPEIIQQ
ncbi:hypothetical protein [Zestomonas carbonaria]|nr:hypothetical protein [Pseudomonas carbonaria]